MIRRRFRVCSAVYNPPFTRSYSTPPKWSPLKALDDGSLEIFRKEAFDPSLPAVLPKGLFLGLPAAQKWFFDPRNGKGLRLNTTYLTKFGSVNVPLEYTILATSSASEPAEAEFQRTEAPFQIFLDWAEHATAETQNRLYLAQASFNDLPKALTDDLPTPDIVTKGGRGDLYDTNLWIGMPPTYTPLHRDPNPNLFVQLVGQKRVRLLAPQDGHEIFASVQMALGRSGSAAFRGDEMMKGQEKALLEEQIWNEAAKDGSRYTSGYEALLECGDGLFVPKGWWHSIKGVGDGITGSVSR